VSARANGVNVGGRDGVVYAPENEPTPEEKESARKRYAENEAAKRDDSSQQGVIPTRQWPCIDQAALHGPAGEFVGALDPHTESDPVAVLVQLLVAFGSAVGRGPHHRVEADEHHMNLYATLVGATSKGRKGTSWGHIRRAIGDVDPSWADRVVSGLSSGEGLTAQVRDPRFAPDDDGEMVLVDPGVKDKRLLVVETEFAGALKVLSREGNTLSAKVRDAWDGKALQTMVKNSPLLATNTHIAIIGHVTKVELVRYLAATEAGNGFANRFLWVCVQRSKELPDGGSLKPEDLLSSISLFRTAVEFARKVTAMPRSPAAATLWREVYSALSRGAPGLLGAVTCRAEAQVSRLACIYALLDMSPVVELQHLEAGLALWKYCEASAAYIFGDALGDPAADRILEGLRRAGQKGLSRTDISKLFQNNVPAATIAAALTVLVENHLAEMKLQPTGGRTEERWYERTKDTKEGGR
jgi:hypothetical protein